MKMSPNLHKKVDLVSTYAPPAIMNEKLKHKKKNRNMTMHYQTVQKKHKGVSY